MKIVAATNMPLVEEAFGRLGTVTVHEGRRIDASMVRDADLLALRSTTRVDAALLAGSRVRFVGTATIGTDHLDIPWLEANRIAWTYAPGCNANSVAEYIVAALLELSVRHGVPLAGRTLGVIGVGNVGRRVVAKAAALGLRVLQHDPPREREEGGDAFVSRETLLDESDIVTLHVPLNRTGLDCTMQLADAAFFGAMRRGAVFINAARGAVMDGEALGVALADGQVGHAVLDTWPTEPGIPLELLAAATIGTPHIAGHSYEGKAAGTQMVYEAACRFLGRPVACDCLALLPPPPVPTIRLEAPPEPVEAALHAVVRQVYDIMADDARLRGGQADMAHSFDAQRRAYPVRREFRFTEVTLPAGCDALARALAVLDFTIRDSQLDGAPCRLARQEPEIGMENCAVCPPISRSRDTRSRGKECCF